MAIIYWKLGHLTAEGFHQPLDAFLIFRDGLVFDIDSRGWDLGIRPGQGLAEMKWKYPGATWIPWQADYYRKLAVSLQEWLRHHAVAYEQTDPREGWWEWPRLTESEWRKLVDQIVPCWAQRIDAGVASHPWLAHWIAENGAQLKLPRWSSSLWKTYVLHPKKENEFWPHLPLRFVEGIPVKTRQQWRKRRWDEVQDVPGLLDRVRSHTLAGTLVHQTEKLLVRRFDELVRGGVGEILGDMARELEEICRTEDQGIRFLQLTWLRNAGMERREREWPIAAGDRKSIRARVLSLLNHPPSSPFDEVRLKARLEPVAPTQIAWWDCAPERPRLAVGIANLTQLAPDRRELLLQHWDLWRMAGGDYE